jgi:putative DNA primase/helicase
MTVAPMPARPPARAPKPPTLSLTERAHAERFAARYANQIRYHHRRGVWLFFDDPIWRVDRNDQIVIAATDFARECQKAAVDLPADQKAKTIAFLLRAELKSGLDHAIALAKSCPPLNDPGDGWDADPWVLGAPNGIIDLRTGTRRPGRPEDKITLSVAVPFDPDAPAPGFAQFLAAVFDGDADLVTFVQRFAGYALTGATTEQVLALFYGLGANGKTTLINLIGRVLGDYSHNLPFATIELRQRAAIPNDLAALEGKRFVTASETNDGSRLNEARIKALTGCDPISARFMHSEWFTFRPVAKFVLAVNHKPVVLDDSIGFWRRIRLVPFARTFTGAERDDRLEDRLFTTEGAGILTWLVRGCLDWQAHGLGAPAVVREATSDYQLDSDPLADFVHECCEPDPAVRTPASTMHEAYAKWADKRRLKGADRLNDKEFGGRMAQKFDRKHTERGKVYLGVKLTTGQLW